MADFERATTRKQITKPYMMEFLKLNGTKEQQMEYLKLIEENTKEEPLQFDKTRTGKKIQGMKGIRAWFIETCQPEILEAEKSKKASKAAKSYIDELKEAFGL